MASRRADERGLDFGIEGRDFGLEGMEESADGVNYACWWLLVLTVLVRDGRITEQDFEECQFDVNAGLGHFAAAFFYFQRARDRLVA